MTTEMNEIQIESLVKLDSFLGLESWGETYEKALKNLDDQIYARSFYTYHIHKPNYQDNSISTIMITQASRMNTTRFNVKLTANRTKDYKLSQESFNLINGQFTLKKTQANSIYHLQIDTLNSSS